MQPRRQRTIERVAETRGIGFLTAADVTLRFRPAPPNHGVAFRRVDLPGSEPVPARIEYAVPRERRTAISDGLATIEMTEHVLAALAGLRVDNCLVEIDAPEPPGMDGSSRAFVDALLDAGIVEQDAPRDVLVIEEKVAVTADGGGALVNAAPPETGRPALVISFNLDYGPDAPFPPQLLRLEIAPETFVDELAFARTFVLEREVEALRAQGYGRRTTARDLIVFAENGGVIDNELHRPDECVRHKVLDCVGDLALLGCDLIGTVHARRSGHHLNRELVRELLKTSKITSAVEAA